MKSREEKEEWNEREVRTEGLTLAWAACLSAGQHTQAGMQDKTGVRDSHPKGRKMVFRKGRYA